MRRIYLLTLLSFLILYSCKENVASKIKEENLIKAEQRDAKLATEVPIMTFEETEHDFGTIDEGDVVETEFKFTNTGKTDLIITNAYASCG